MIDEDVVSLSLLVGIGVLSFASAVADTAVGTVGRRLAHLVRPLFLLALSLGFEPLTQPSRHLDYRGDLGKSWMYV